MCEQVWEKEKIIYQENCTNFRHLNEILWRVPVLAMTLTGGLWFGIASLNISNNIRIVLLLLSCVANLIFIVVLFRLRKIMDRYLRDIRNFENKELSHGYIVVSFFSLLLFVSASCCAYIIWKVNCFFGN